MHQKYARLVVLYITDEKTEVQSKVFFSRANARSFCRSLQDKPNVQAYGMYRIGTKLGSYLRTSPMADMVLQTACIE